MSSASSNLFRSFPFERQSWRKTIAQSELPSEAQGLIRAVVKKSRLMRFEKIEVVEELISHFLEGRQLGKSYAQLTANFGDPQVTATLIRRSKIRNRPIMFKILSIIGWSMLALASVYLVIMSWFHMGKPSPSIDYLVDFNQGIRETDENDKAWPIYRPMWIKYGFSEGGGFHEQMQPLFHHEENHQYKALIRPTDPGWPGAVTKLEELSDLLEAFREGRYKPRLGVELHADLSKYTSEDFAALFPGREAGNTESGFYDYEHIGADVKDLLDAAIINIMLPHIQSFRQAARIFTVDTRLAVEQNDTDRAVQNIETMLGLARQVTDSNTLVGSLIGFAVGSIGFNSLEEVLVENPEFFSEQQLDQLQTTVENLSIRDWMNIHGERAFLMDIIQRVYTDDGKGDGRVTSVGLRMMEAVDNSLRNSIEENLPEFEGAIKFARHVAEPASLFVFASRKETTDKANYFLDGFESELDIPFWEWNDPNKEFEQFLEKNALRYRLLASMMPAIQQVRRAMVRVIGRQEGVIAALASHRYFLANNEWPESFEQLSPEFVIEFPVDQINGKFVNLLVSENGPVVYSVGNDKDDDGGSLIIDRYGKKKSAASFLVGSNSDDDGDWILWPQLESQIK